MRIVDPETGADLACGEVGELWTRSAQNMLGYAGRPEETSAALDAEGWLRTGDLGYRDGCGYFYLHDRLKDMIVSGAENVYPAEVENAIMAHPGVADVAVIGVPSERWGETVKAIVMLAQDARGAQLSEHDVIDFSRTRLTHYKCPTTVDFVTDPLPRNPSGKLLKRVIREPYWAGRTRRIT
jgi:long-chain acyl-CoA synthetase